MSMIMSPTPDSGQQGSLPNKISRLKRMLKHVQKEMKKDDADKKEIQKKVKKLSDELTKLIENDVQDSLVSSIDGLKRYIKNEF